MADFNKILNPGDYENGEINVVVEIPTGSNHKIEWDRKNACFMLDRVEPIAFAKPCNYGFIPQTLDEDGDEKLNVDEVKKLGDLMGLDVTVSDAWATIATLDVNSDNLVDFAEFCAIIGQ